MKKLLFLLAAPLMLCGCDQLKELSNQLGGDDKVAEYIIQNAEKWDDAWEDMFFTNYVMDVHATTAYSNGEQTMSESMHNHLELNDNAILYVLGADTEIPHESYYVENANEVWKAYRFDGASRNYLPYDPVETGRAETVQQFKDKLASEASLFISFKNYYDKFVFDKDKGEYYCESIISVDLDDQVYKTMDLAARKSHVKFEKGKLVSISAEYVCVYANEGLSAEQVFEQTDKAGASYRFEIKDINKTVVTRPTNIVE